MDYAHVHFGKIVKEHFITEQWNKWTKIIAQPD